MTEMRRITISFDKESEEAIEIVKTKAEKPISNSEAVRRLILRGYQEMKKLEVQHAQG